jgi:hypothetical protein
VLQLQIVPLHIVKLEIISAQMEAILQVVHQAQNAFQEFAVHVCMCAHPVQQESAVHLIQTVHQIAVTEVILAINSQLRIKYFN